MRKISSIVVPGGIGVGKTTLGTNLSKYLPKNHYFIEDVDENPYLSQFYQDMKAWGFHSRVAYLAMKTQIYRMIPPDVDFIILDRSVHELVVFAKLQHDLGNFVGNDFKIYMSLYETLIYLSPIPDIIVYVKCSEESSLLRIRNRGRLYEQHITREYLSMVNQYYENWLKTFDPDRIIVVTSDTSASPLEVAKKTADVVLTRLAP